jgi:hypothetical protein
VSVPPTGYVPCQTYRNATNHHTYTLRASVRFRNRRCTTYEIVKKFEGGEYEGVGWALQEPPRG